MAVTGKVNAMKGEMSDGVGKECKKLVTAACNASREKGWEDPRMQKLEYQLKIELLQKGKYDMARLDIFVTARKARHFVTARKARPLVTAW